MNASLTLNFPSGVFYFNWNVGPKVVGHGEKVYWDWLA